MKISAFDCRAFSVGLCVAMLAGCGGSQMPAGGPGTVPQTAPIAPARPLENRMHPAWSVNVLHGFGGYPDGDLPGSGLDNLEGTFYGTTYYGGTHAVGTVYKITPNGAETVLHSFGAASDGAFPYAGLIHANGMLYGTTRHDSGDGCGGLGCGTVYRISPNGTETVLHTFGSGSDGWHPMSSLLDVNGTLYGTTHGGGTSDKGTVYAISTDGVERVLHSFSGGSDGAKPIGGLTEVRGMLYGTTTEGGTSDKGTVYSIDTDGTEKVLHSFAGGTDGSRPEAGLAGVNGTLFGVTSEGGTSNKGVVFRIEADGKEVVLHTFSGSPDGAYPIARLIHVNGTLYGTTFLGGDIGCYGSTGCGTVYSITTGGVEQVIHSFGVEDGAKPETRLLHDNGTLYGTTTTGGPYGGGTVYSLTP